MRIVLAKLFARRMERLDAGIMRVEWTPVKSRGGRRGRAPPHFTLSSLCADSIPEPWQFALLVGFQFARYNRSDATAIFC